MWSGAKADTEIMRRSLKSKLAELRVTTSGHPTRSIQTRGSVSRGCEPELTRHYGDGPTLKVVTVRGDSTCSISRCFARTVVLPATPPWGRSHSSEDHQSLVHAKETAASMTSQHCDVLLVKLLSLCC